MCNRTMQLHCKVQLLLFMHFLPPDYCNLANLRSSVAYSRYRTPQYWILPSLGESQQSCVTRYTGYMCVSASRSRSIRSSATVSTDQHRSMYLQEICKRDFALLTMATWLCQHWQIQSAWFFCVRAEPVEQATTAHWKVSDKPEQCTRVLKSSSSHILFPSQKPMTIIKHQNNL